MMRWMLFLFVGMGMSHAASLAGLEALGQENTPRAGAVIRSGFSYANPALLAWEDKTTFSGLLHFENTVASRDDYSLTSQTFGVPSLTMGIPLGFLGAIGIGLQQHYNAVGEISESDSADGVDATLKYSGSLFEVVPTYALRLPWMFRDFSVGVNTRLIFGRTKRTLSLNADDAQVDAADRWAMDDVALTQKAEGNWETDGGVVKRLGASVHYHRRDVDYYIGFVAPYTLRRKLTYNLQFGNTDTLRPREVTQELDVPLVLSTGFHWRLAKKHHLSFEYAQQAWDGKLPLIAGGWNLADSAETQTQKHFSLEYELEGSGLYYDSFLKKNSYRLALWLKEWYLADVTEAAASLGVGMPLGRRGTLVDVSFYGGMRENASSGWDEAFWGLKFGFTGVGTWGQKSRRY